MSRNNFGVPWQNNFLIDNCQIDILYVQYKKSSITDATAIIYLEDITYFVTCSG